MYGIECKPIGFDRARLFGLLKEAGLGGILLTSPENVFYSTGFPALPSSGNPILYTLRNRLPFFSYMDREGRVVLLCWDFAAEGSTFGVDEVQGFDRMGAAIQAVASLVKERLDPQAPLGIESTCPYYVFDAVKQAVQPVAFSVVDRLLERLRLIKSPEEIARIRTSTEIIEQTMTELVDVIHVGMSRLDLIREAKYRLFRNGGSGVSHATFAFGLANPEIAIGEVLEEGKLVTLDLGGIYEGYASDTRRYLYAGAIPESVTERYDMMVEIVDQVGAALVPGKRFCDVFQLARDLYAKHNLAPQFGHVGHNIGLETEEAWLSIDEERPVEPGMVINIELYSYAETGDHVGNEETFVVGPEGSTRISTLPREIRRVVR